MAQKLSEKRKQLLRENRQLLKQAGFSAADVDRYKGASRENVLKAIADRALPELREEKRTARKVKPEKKVFAGGTQESLTFTMKSTSDNYIAKFKKEIMRSIKQGYNYIMVQGYFASQSGQEYISRSQMTPTAGMTWDDILVMINNELDSFMEAYEEYIRKVKVEVILWKAKRKS